MPTVPQYQRSVSPQVTPNEYVKLNVNEDMFGINITNAQKNVANQLGGIGELVESIKDRVEDTKLIELKNKSAEWEQQNIYDNQNGYLYKTGKDAYGQSETLLKSYDTYMQDLLQKSNLSPSARRRAQGAISDWRTPVQRTITKHDFEQGVSWAGSEAATGLSNYVSNAVNMRNNPDEIKKSIESGYQIIEWKGEIQHLDRTAIDAEKRKYLMSVNEGVLNALLGEGSLKASGYLEANKGSISPEKLPQYISAVKENELNYTASTTAAGLVGLPIEEAYKKINSISDPQTRNATEREYNRYVNQADNIQKEKDAKAANDIMQQVFQLKDSGGSISEIMTKVNASDMSIEMKGKILDNLKKMQDMEQYGNAWADYNYLVDLASYDHEAFLKVSPATYNLTKDQYNKITELQRKGSDVQYSTEVQLEKIAKKFDTSFGWQKPRMNGGNGLYSDEYQKEIVGFLSLLEMKQGKAFDIDHIDEGQLAAIAKGLGYKNPFEKNKNIDETKELWMRAQKHGDFKGVLVANYQSFKAENKREPNEVEMYELAKRSYNWIETEWQQRGQNKLKDQTTLYKNINLTSPKKGETRALTYLADTTIPAIGRKLGVRYTYVDGARFRKGDAGNHGKGLSLDVSMSEHNMNTRVSSFEEFAALPHIKSIGTSDPILLKRYAGNSKLKNLTAYDKTHGTNHVNHMHITVDERYGGKGQGK